MNFFSDLNKRIILIVFIPILSVQFSIGNCFAQTNQITNLNSNWQFRKAGNAVWLPATVPGTIHTDLLNNKIIPDPFFGDNEKKLQWIDTCNWEYQTFFDVDQKQFAQSHIEIIFNGLDTYAKIFLNDSLIITADNMFRTWKYDCKKLLKKNQNHLLVQFESAVKKGKELAAKLPYTLPGDEKVFTRKAAYHYGWDWGPRFVTCGIWRSVSLFAWHEIKIESVQIHQLLLNDSIAKLNATIEVNTDDNNGIFSFYSSLQGSNISLAKTTTVPKGISKVEIPFEIKNPKRWWCNGLGKPYLYNASFAVGDATEMFDSEDEDFGLRTIELIQENDSVGKSFYFKLNGVPVFMKGANYIPADNFLPRVSEKRSEEIVQSAVDANMNMLRVWGGGIYEDDKFYDLCDKKGILVWQDFMFACSMYPGDSAFVNNVKEEAVENVKRLRSHPCIALWCGNNEIDEGWHNWGWQQQFHYSKNDSAKIWNDYLKIFHQTIPQVVSKYDGTRAYWESSPSIGWGHEESLRQGDSHYWGVWWGNEEFDVYKKKVGRFMSEYGFQGMPSLSTFKKFCDEKDLTLNSDAVKNHQKHPTGYETIQKYLERDYKQPKDFENYIYVSQLLQADGIRIAIDAHRRAKPRCMGTLYWQLNDCWPVTSWSSTDYFGNWKALHYAVEKSYAEKILSLDIEGGKAKIFFVNDALENFNAEIKIHLMDFTGKILWQQKINSMIEKNSSALIFSIDTAALLKYPPMLKPDRESLRTDLSGFSTQKIFLNVEAYQNDSLIADNILYFTSPKNLQLTKPNFIITPLNDSNDIHRFEISADVLAKNIYLSMPGSDVTFSDNFFDMIPAKKYLISFSGINFKSTDVKKIIARSLVDTY